MEKVHTPPKTRKSISDIRKMFESGTVQHSSPPRGKDISPQLERLRLKQELKRKSEPALVFACMDQDHVFTEAVMPGGTSQEDSSSMARLIASGDVDASVESKEKSGACADSLTLDDIALHTGDSTDSSLEPTLFDDTEILGLRLLFSLFDRLVSLMGTVLLIRPQLLNGLPFHTAVASCFPCMIDLEQERSPLMTSLRMLKIQVCIHLIVLMGHIH